MAYENLPQTAVNKIDGNLIKNDSNQNPVVCVIGTAPQGNSDNLTTVLNPGQQASTFGKKDGTLVRGMYEVIQGGAENIRIYRIGATAAELYLIGTATGVGGISIETIDQDDVAGLAYKLFWDDTAERLKVWRVSDDLLVYDNNPAYPSAAVDENEVSVLGSVVGIAGGGSRTDIGTADVPVTMAAANGVGGAVYVAGTDGITLSRMELFEELYKAYDLLENEDIDIVVPMNAYLDDTNVMDMTTTEISAMSLTWSGVASYPTPGTSSDVLGKVFVQEYEGEWHFWWDVDGDGVAEVWPSVGLASFLTDAEGTALTADDFHEANFGYQLADFCYRQSEDNQEMTGVIGVKPPNSWALKDVSSWIGTAPTYEEDGSGNLLVDSNGSGLLGNKWLAGRRANAGTGISALTIGNLAGLAYGGFIATDTGWPDGTQQEDRNDHLIDIGKYISVVGAQCITSNPTSSTSYKTTGAPYYAGFYSGLAGNSAPTNKVIDGLRLPFRISIAKLDDLAGYRYVMFQDKAKGNVVSDAPTAARPDSDYQRLSTVRIVKSCVDAIRAVSDPFIGEPITGARLAALETAIDNVLLKLQKAEYLQRYAVKITSTAQQRVRGEADCELTLVPAFELRQLTVNVSLAAQ